MTDWGTELVMICIGAFVGWIFSQFKISTKLTNHFFGPKLHLVVDAKDGSDVCVPLLDEQGRPIGTFGRYFRVKVRNAKGRPATGVRGYLTDIQRYDDATKGYESVGFVDTVPLNWSYRQNEPFPPAIEIPYQVKQYLDVASVTLKDEQGPAIFAPVICASNLPSAYRNILASGGKYCLRVLVAADQYVHEEIGMIFEWDGKLAPLKIEIRPRNEVKSLLSRWDA